MTPRAPFPDLPSPNDGIQPPGTAVNRVSFLGRLILGVMAVALVVVILTGLALSQNLEHYRERASTNTQNLAHLLEQSLFSAIEKNDVALYSVSQAVQTQFNQGRADWEIINNQLFGIFFQLNLIDGMAIADESGIIRHSVRIAPACGASILDRGYFLRLRDEPRAKSLLSSAEAVNGKELLTLARRIDRPDGTFGGVVLASITLERLLNAFSALDVGINGVVTLRNEDFEIIARYPERQDKGGKAAISPAMREGILAGKETGTYTLISAMDGIERTFSYRKIPNYPFFVTVGLATDDYLATWRAEAAKASVLAMLFILSLLLSAALVYRAWQRRAGAILALGEQEEKYRALVETTSDWIWEVDQNCCFTYSSPGVRKLLGYEPEELVGQPMADFLPGAIMANASSGQPGSAPFIRAFSRVESATRAKDGEERVLESSGVPTLGQSGQFKGYRGISRDITERKLREAELGLAASVFNTTLEGVVVTDMNAVILSVNPAFTDITGYSPEEAIGSQPSLLRSDHHGPEFYQGMWERLVKDGCWSGEIWNRRKNGEAYLEWLTISKVAEPDGKTKRYVGVFSDITELRRKDEDIRHLAFHDPLTGLPNRALLFNRLEHAITVARRERTRLAVMFVDLDRFKAINDSLGHDVGDSLLKEVAARLGICVRQSDTVARMGGDEFVILLEPTGGMEAYASLARKIIDSLAQPMLIASQAIQVGGSIGIACFPDDGETAVELMKHADAAMYAAKSDGRNTYRFFQPAMTAKAAQRLQLEMELRHAVENGELELFYQPQVALESNTLCGVEALLRWRHPQQGLVSPADFIPLAEETGLICDLGDWVLVEACRQAKEWLSAGLAVGKVAVNVSAKQLQKGDFVDRIAGLINEYGIPSNSLEIELTESVVMADPEKATKVFGQLRGLGVSIAMDDFGTGYSSLAYLRRLPIDTVKIDRSFVLDAHQDEEDAQIVRTILALAQILKLSVVAEGVETERHAAFLKACGCPVGQGYFYARPAPALAMATWQRDLGVKAGQPATAQA